MKKIQFLLLCSLFLILLYGKGDLKDTVTICANGLVYELTLSLGATENGSGTNPDSVSCVKLIKQGKVVGKSIFPLSGRCPIEEDISVEASDNGFIIRIPYCDGYLFRFGEARFVYSKGQNDFILTAYEEEIIDRQHPELDGKVVKYNICAKVPIVLSTFSVVEIRNNTDNNAG